MPREWRNAGLSQMRSSSAASASAVMGSPARIRPGGRCNPLDTPAPLSGVATILTITHGVPKQRRRLRRVHGCTGKFDLRVTLEPMAYREMPDFRVIEVVVGPGGVRLLSLVDYCVAYRWKASEVARE